jgi:hypothetical protein
MKAQASEPKPHYTIAGTLKNKTLFLRENMSETINEEGYTLYNYDEYRMEMRTRPDIEQYIIDNFDALILKAKQAEIAQVKVNMEKTIDRHIDQIAKDKGYGRVDVSPSAACLGYASYTNQYQAEAITYGEWIASIWPVVHQIMADVEAGTREIPTEQELIAAMPEMGWPT